MIDNQDLVRNLQNGDPEALRQIYYLYKDDLLTMATCMLADSSAAEDCLHDVMVILAGAATRIRIAGSLKGYLMTCAANRARDLLRSKSRNNHAALGENITIKEYADDRPSPAADLAQREMQCQVMQALMELPAEQRIVVTLHLHGDMTFEEISAQEGVCGNTVRSRYRYGLEKLRTQLQIGAPS